MIPSSDRKIEAENVYTDYWQIVAQNSNGNPVQNV
jgi:hypothetical protein